ncbi:succinate dehydrogenase cytochrome b subunit [Polluticaenibacter yanchengensis]|uniref:Succinate dehydrogenase cytochrome b subunit n=1 Tax=Polluticaenibacter yanchengensis TaxID=3014562 RepID=A0ABT4UFN9_9BACT|nr:succinate dehydrogenase cytochrome b subunit [Chitinophagaceae bacterium LY-5]
MTWKQLFISSVGKKVVMGLTGISLVAFLLVHAGLNACIWANDDGQMFNKAAHFMGSTVITRTLEIGLFIGIILHIVQGYMLAATNKAKRSIGYNVQLGNRGSKWYSRSMALLGSLILIFLAIHLSDFFIPSRITHAGLETPKFYDGDTTAYHDMYRLMINRFQDNILAVIIYIVGCIALAYHLFHGFQSAFRSLGVHNKKYNQLLTSLGYGYTVVVILAFIMMPLSIFFGWIS